MLDILGLIAKLMAFAVFASFGLVWVCLKAVYEIIAWTITEHPVIISGIVIVTLIRGVHLHYGLPDIDFSEPNGVSSDGDSSDGDLQDK